jgi:hypothetical protein
MPEAKAARKPGAQPGNKNALKHGFYAHGFTADQSERLADSDRFSLEAEIDLLRVCMDRLAAELSFAAIEHHDQQGNSTRDNHYLAQLNTLSIMTQSISTMIRTHYLTRGKGGALEQGIMEALEELRLELGL